jgi:hypothetical protein
VVSAAFPGIFVYLILWAVIPLAEAKPSVPVRSSEAPGATVATP